MKITKILSAAAAAVVAVSAVAVSASADFRPVTGGAEYCLADGTGNYGICLFSDGTNKDNVPAMSVDIDLSQVTHVSAHSDKTNDDADLYNKYNWATAGNFWGVIDEDLGLETRDDTQGILAEKVGDYTYKIEADVINPVANGDIGNLSLYRIFMQVWSFTMSDIEVVKTELSDANGNVLATFDALGNVTYGAGAAADETPAADDNTAADAATVDAEAPAATTTTEKGSPDTGVEGIAAVAGVAVVAAGAVVLSKKRK